MREIKMNFFNTYMCWRHGTHLKHTGRLSKIQAQSLQKLSYFPQLLKYFTKSKNCKCFKFHYGLSLNFFFNFIHNIRFKSILIIYYSVQSINMRIVFNVLIPPTQVSSLSFSEMSNSLSSLSLVRFCLSCPGWERKLCTELP